MRGARLGADNEHGASHHLEDNGGRIEGFLSVMKMKADLDKILNLLKTARGQLDGLVRMVEDDRYCIDISNQILATIAILKKVNVDVLTEHLEHCVRESFDDDEDKIEKIREIKAIIRKLCLRGRQAGLGVVSSETFKQNCIQSGQRTI